MASRTSNRSTKAVTCIESTESDNNDEIDASETTNQHDNETQVRSVSVRRKRTIDDEDWNAQNEGIANDDDEEEIADDDTSDNDRDVTRKVKGTRSVESVYDFG
jgi:hypothetical protein